MSAFVSFQDSNEICLLTDGAAYDVDGIVRYLGRKVTIGKVARIAVTTRGNHVMGRQYQQELCNQADADGVDHALEAFAIALPRLGMRPKLRGFDRMEWHICAWSETRGLIRLSAHNLPYTWSGEEPLTLTPANPAKSYQALPGAGAEQLFACGVQPRAVGESLSHWVDRIGAAFMEAQRRTKGQPTGVDCDAQFVVGGQADLTVVTRDGVAVKMLRKWPDRIGEPIDPFGGAENVVPLPRHLRRAAARKLARRA